MWFVCWKASEEAIVFAGLRLIENGVCEETGIALVPNYTGKGYETELLNLLTELAQRDYNAHLFHACCQSENGASRRMILSCGFHFTHSDSGIDTRNQKPFIMELYEKDL